MTPVLPMNSRFRLFATCKGPTGRVECCIYFLNFSLFKTIVDDDIVSLYEPAVAAQPGNEELANHLFMAITRTNNFKALQGVGFLFLTSKFKFMTDSAFLFLSVGE